MPLPLPRDKGFALVVGGGAAIAAHGSLSSKEAVVFLFTGFEVDFGGATAMEPHKSSSCCAAGFAFREFDAVLGSGAASAPHRSSASFDDLIATLGGKEPVPENKTK